jgi:hypothetical protein
MWRSAGQCAAGLPCLQLRIPFEQNACVLLLDMRGSAGCVHLHLSCTWVLRTYESVCRKPVGRCVCGVIFLFPLTGVLRKHSSTAVR